MKGSHFIHCILIVALCLGQVVANAHVISHIGVPISAKAGADEHQTNHLGALAHAHAHTQEHHRTSLSLEQSSADELNEELNSDCAIYHAYAGSAALTPAVCNAIAVGSRLTLVINYHHSNLYTGSADTQPIRGPPSHS